MTNTYENVKATHLGLCLFWDFVFFNLSSNYEFCWKKKKQTKKEICFQIWK